MIRRAPRGFVLLVVLAAVAVLSLIAAFIYSQTENQLVLSIAARGQSVAASRATLAAERTLALYRSSTTRPDTALNNLVAQPTYDAARAAGQILPAELPATPAPYDRSVELSAGGGAQWCVQVWKLFRSSTLPPWTIIEAYGFYGFTGATAPYFRNCEPQPVDNDRMFTSHVTVFLSSDGTSPTSCGECQNGGLGTGAPGAG